MHLSDSSCAPIFQFFDAALDGATTNRQIPDRIFPQLFTSLRKDNVANYASIWTLFSCDVSVFHNGFIFQMHYTVLIFVARWRHKTRKFAVEILQSVNNRAQSLRETTA